MKEYMMKILAVALGVIALHAFQFPIVQASASEWKSASKVSREINRMKRKGMIPSSLACRNVPGVKNRLKPEAKIAWKKNSSKKEWAALLYKGQLDFMPAPKGQIRQWRRLYKKRLRAGASGAIYNCSLWHRR